MTQEKAKLLLHPSTTEDAINKIRYYSGFNGDEAVINAIDEACLVACEVIDNQQKYRWHDLRENPEDMPEEHDSSFECLYGTERWREGKMCRKCSDGVLVCFETSDGYRFIFYRHSWDGKFISPIDFDKSMKAIAWKPVEMFEDSYEGE